MRIMQANNGVFKEQINLAVSQVCVFCFVLKFLFIFYNLFYFFPLFMNFTFILYFSLFFQ